MSYQVIGNDIILTRGDTLRLKVNILKDGEPYVPVDGEIVRFALKRNRYTGSGYTELADSTPLIKKTVPNDSLILELLPEDTKNLSFGQYLYDLELTMADGTVDTFICNANFKIAVEVD